MAHSWNCYNISKKISKCLISNGIINEKDELISRGIIQIILEQNINGE
jgi:hypothetical protein